MSSFRTVSFIRCLGYLTVTAFYEIYSKESMIIELLECSLILFCKSFLAVGHNGHGRGKYVKQLAVGNIDDPDEARDNMKVPEKICVDSYISQELR